MFSPDNAGLEIPIDALSPIVTQYVTPTTGLSRADIWALAGLTGAEIFDCNGSLDHGCV